MTLQSLRIQGVEPIEVGQSQGVHGSVCSASRGPHPGRQRRRRTHVSTPSSASPHRPVRPFRTKTSYYSGITDACITFVAASQHVLLTLNASLRRRWTCSRQIMRWHAMLSEEMHMCPNTTLNKNPTECACLVAVRLYPVSSMKCPTCMPPRDAVPIRKDLVRPL